MDRKERRYNRLLVDSKKNKTVVPFVVKENIQRKQAEKCKIIQY